MDPGKQSTSDAVASAVEALRAEGLDVTVRAVQERVGGHSVSTIHHHLKRYKAETTAKPFEPGEAYRQLIRAVEDLVKRCVEEATRTLKTEANNLGNYLDTLSQSLVKAESENAKALEKAVDQERIIAELKAEVKMVGLTLASTSAELEKTRAELAKLTIRRDDYQNALAEAAQAREKAALLEGRLEGIELERSKRETASTTRRTEDVEKIRASSSKKDTS